MWTLVFVLVTAGAPEQRLPEVAYESKQACRQAQIQMLNQYRRLPDDVTIRTYCDQDPHGWTAEDIPELRKCWRTQTCGGYSGDSTITIEQNIYLHLRRY